jgi:hypothetical protein
VGTEISLPTSRASSLAFTRIGLYGRRCHGAVMSLRCWLRAAPRGQKGRLEALGEPLASPDRARVGTGDIRDRAELTSGRVPLPDVEKAITIDSYVPSRPCR